MKVRLMIIIGVISFLLGGCNKIQKNSNQVQLVQRTEEILQESGTAGNKAGNRTGVQGQIALGNIPAQRLAQQDHVFRPFRLQNPVKVAGHVVHGEVQGEGPGGGMSRSVPDQTVIFRKSGNLLIE